LKTDNSLNCRKTCG